jgi:catechol 2,3-dioxygenase
MTSFLSTVHRSSSGNPDGNGVELYRDRPREDWPARMITAPLDLRALLAEAEG